MAEQSYFYLKEKMKMESQEPASQECGARSRAVCIMPPGLLCRCGDSAR